MDVGSAPISLTAAASVVSAVAAVVTLYFRGRTRERIKAMEAAPSETKAKLVADAIAMFEIDAKELSTDQQYKLAVKQLEDRSAQRRRQFIAFLFLTGILAATAIAFAVIQGKPGSGVTQINGVGGMNINNSPGARASTGSASD